MFKFELGQEVEDMVTGYKGHIVGRAEHLTGCNTYGIQRKWKPTEEKVANSEYFDENRLKPLKGKITINIESPKDKGGPQQHQARI